MRQRIGALIVTITATVITACSGRAGDPELAGRTSEAIIMGTPMTPAAAASKGLVSIATPITPPTGGCSGVLLNNSWALTAEHCVWPPGVAQTAATISVQSADTSIPAVNSDRYFSFGPEDVLLVHVPTPIPVNESTTGFSNTLSANSVTPFSTVTCMGFGQSAAGPAGIGTIGTWRSSTNSVSGFTADTFTIAANNLMIPAPGDSGGPCFLNGAIAGITSNVGVICPTGTVNCTPTSVGVQIVSATETSATFLAPWINGIMSGNPAIRGPGLGVPSVTQSLGANSGGSGRFGNQGNFELVAPTADGRLAHFWRNNDAPGSGSVPGYPWTLSAIFGENPGNYDGASLIWSTFNNLEVVATSGGKLFHFFSPSPGSWSDPPTAIPGANQESGAPTLVQSTYNSGCRVGNFEVAVANATSGVDYFWRDNCAPGFPWHQSPTVATSLGQVLGLSMIESHYGTMELVVEVATGPGCGPNPGNERCMYHLTRDALFNWGSPVLITKNPALEPPSLSVSRFGVNGNFELAVPSPNGGIDYYFKVNDPTPTAVGWQQASPASQETGFFYRGVSLFQSNMGNAPGDMELFGSRIADADATGPIDFTWRSTQNFSTTGLSTNPPSSDWRWVGPFEIESP